MKKTFHFSFVAVLMLVLALPTVMSAAGSQLDAEFEAGIFQTARDAYAATEWHQWDEATTEIFIPAKDDGFDASAIGIYVSELTEKSRNAMRMRDVLTHTVGSERYIDADGTLIVASEEIGRAHV